MRFIQYFKVFSIIFLSILFVNPRAQASIFNMPTGVTPLSHDIYLLHMTIFSISVAIGALVFAVLIFSLIKHRKSVGHKPADFHSSVRIEVLWAVIPFLLLVAMAVPATGVLMRMEDDSKSEVNIKITGYQWKWKYEYLDSGISFFSNLKTPLDQITGKTKKNKWYLLEVDNPLVVPVNKKIRFLVTSNDVIHSWWVPDFGIKRDAIPGFIHEAWARIEKPGIYRGQCAELCGINHGFMPIVVIAKAEAEYEAWLAEKAKAATTATKNIPSPPMNKETLLAKGKEIYTSTCSVCHKEDGAGMPPAFPPLKGSPITIGPVKNHIAIVLNGKTGTAMQAFANQLTDEQIAAVVTYERNSWGNDDKSKFGDQAGGLVQPADVTKAR